MWSQGHKLTNLIAQCFVMTLFKAFMPLKRNKVTVMALMLAKWPVNVEHVRRIIRKSYCHALPFFAFLMRPLRGTFSDFGGASSFTACVTIRMASSAFSCNALLSANFTICA